MVRCACFRAARVVGKLVSFFSRRSSLLQKFLGGEFLSCAGLLESKHIGPFLLIPAFPSPPHQLAHKSLFRRSGLQPRRKSNREPGL